MAIFQTLRSLQTACESFEKNWRPLSESVLHGHPQRGKYRLISRALGCKFGSSDRVHVGSAADTIGEEQDVGVTSRRDRQGVKVIDADGNAGPFGQGNRDDGPPDHQPRGFPCLAFQAVAKPPPGADAHTNPPVRTFEHPQSARCAEVAGKLSSGKSA